MLLAFSSLSAQQPANASLFNDGRLALARGDWDGAETAFRAVLTREPQSVPALANLGVVLMRRHQWDRALEQFRAAETLAPRNAGLELNIGLALFRKADYQTAASHFGTVLQADPSSQQARYLLALCAFATGSYRVALNSFAALWDSENTNLAYLYVLALSAHKAPEATWEERALGRMDQVGHDTAEYHLFLGRAWLLRQRTDDAYRELQQAARLNTRLPWVHYSLGTMEAERGRFAEARAEFLADAAIEPDLSLNYEQLGDLCSKLGQSADAAHYYQEAIARDRQSVVSYFGLAKLEKAKGQLTHAAKDADAAARLAPDSGRVHYLRAQILAALHETAAAKTEFALSAHLRQAVRDRLEESVSGHDPADAQIALHQ